METYRDRSVVSAGSLVVGLSSISKVSGRDFSTQGAFEMGDGGRFLGRGTVAGRSRRLFGASRRSAWGCVRGSEPPTWRDEVFFKIVPRSYPWNPHVTARAKHVEVQLRLGVALELTLERRPRYTQRERNGGNGGVGDAAGLVEHSGSRSPAHLEYSGFTPRALRCRPKRQRPERFPWAEVAQSFHGGVATAPAPTKIREVGTGPPCAAGVGQDSKSCIACHGK